MYIPKHFELTDKATMHDLMRQFSFATIVSVLEGAPFATHMPVVVRPELGEFGIRNGNHFQISQARVTPKSW
jgi:transcriptional regulator